MWAASCVRRCRVGSSRQTSRKSSPNPTPLHIIPTTSSRYRPGRGTSYRPTISITTRPSPSPSPSPSLALAAAAAAGSPQSTRAAAGPDSLPTTTGSAHLLLLPPPTPSGARNRTTTSARSGRCATASTSVRRREGPYVA